VSGSGKTQVAHELRRRLARCGIADPEHVGFALRRRMPPSRRDAFQRCPAWRRAVVDVLREVDPGREAVVIVTQALLDPDHHTEIIERLRVDGHQVHHFTLTATRRRSLAGYAVAAKDVGSRRSACVRPCCVIHSRR
jgi:hypothetical protein